VRAVTWNINHAGPRGLGAVAEALRAQDADLIALQEVDMGCARSGGVLQARALGEALGMSWGFCRAIPFDGGEYGVALLVKPQLVGGRPLRVTTFRLPGGRLPGEEPRVLLGARAGGLRVFVTHLDLFDDLRLHQAEAVCAAISSTSRAVLLGDFNEGPHGPAVRRVLDFGLRDAWSEAHAPERATAPPDRPQERIDLVLLGAGAGPAFGARAVESDASDHPLVVSDFSAFPAVEPASERGDRR
jgi:endonuclease/exonuclease/phosphatase family metal-dependent hydrolase